MPVLLLPYPVIDPVLLHLGPLSIRWYALAYIAGLVAGWALIRHIVADDRYWRGAPRPSAESIDDLLVYCALGVVIGGRLGQVLFYDPGYYFAHPLEIFMLWHGGMAFHGGMLGALVGVLVVRAPLQNALAHRARSRLSRRADRHFSRPARQFHQAGAVGPADRCRLGDDISGLGRSCRGIRASSTRRRSRGSPISSCCGSPRGGGAAAAGAG